MHSFPVSVSGYFRLRFFVFHCCHCIVMSDCLWPHGLQHARLPYPSPSPRVCSDSCPLSWLCYLTISSSAAPFSFCLQPFPASGSFPVTVRIRWPNYWSFSISPSNEYSRLTSFRIDWFDHAVQGTLKSLLQHQSSKASIPLPWQTAKCRNICSFPWIPQLLKKNA